MFNFFKKEKNEDKKTGFEALKSAVSKTKEAIFGGILNIASDDDKIDEFALEDIETTLIKADVGVELSLEIVEKIKKENIKFSKIKDFLKTEFANILENTGTSELIFDNSKLNVYFITGVNGVGKTTLIGKLAAKMQQAGNKVLLAAADTFRAAAEQQLDIWAKRANVDIVREDKADPASIVYRAIEKAKQEGYNVLIVDTAGRLQNKFNLIEELKKIKGVIDKKAHDANLESILVLDSNLGQNGLSQAKTFLEAVNLTGVALTKLDGSSKGGIIFAIAKEYKLPVKLIGIGEKIEDIRDFNKNDFIEAIFG